MSVIRAAEDLAVNVHDRIQQVPQQLEVGIDCLGREWQQLPKNAKIRCLVIGVVVIAWSLCAMHMSDQLFGRGASPAERQRIQALAASTLFLPVAFVASMYMAYS